MMVLYPDMRFAFAKKCKTIKPRHLSLYVVAKSSREKSRSNLKLFTTSLEFFSSNKSH